jgi:hypothetical protein
LSRPSRGSVKGARRARILAIRASSPGLPIHPPFHCCWSPVFRDADAPASPDAPAGGDDFDSTIREFERATAPQPAAPPEQPQAAPDEIDKLLAELSQPTVSSPLFTQGTDAHQQLQAQEQFSALQSENAQLRAHAQRAADQADLDRLTGEIQAKLPSNLPQDFAVTALKSMAVDRPELVLAFDTRHLDRRAVAAEKTKVEQSLAWLQRNPSAADPGYAAQLQQYHGQLNVALHGREILNRAMREIVSRGQAHRPIDEVATADHDAVAAAVRGSSAKASPEPPPNFGNMSDKQLREYTKTNFGF